MAPATYGDVLARNIRVARSRSRIGQESTGLRMRELGFDAWHRQTAGKVERGERRVTAEEILGLAVALETSVAALIMPEADDEQVEFPAGQVLAVVSVRMSVRGTRDTRITWQGDKPVFPPADAPYTDVADELRDASARIQLEKRVAEAEAKIVELSQLVGREEDHDGDHQEDHA